MLFSKRIALLSALLVVATAHGCSCEDGQDPVDADVAVDVGDSAVADDADDDTASTDAVSDSSSDATDTDLDAREDADDATDSDGSDGDASSEDATDADNDGTDDDTDTVEADTDDADTDPGDTGPADASDTNGSDTSDATADTGDVGTDASADTATPGGDCISGASGTHAVRFGWQGNGPNSTAYVDYEVNELPDTSRWKAGAYAQSFSYTPVYTDTFLGDGGLELSGTVFMDIELSTLGLSSVSKATIGIYGRSFDTTSSGSYTWQTFSGTGAAPSGLVANSAPYQWYTADATAALPAGDDGILLRIYPGPPSNSLVVNSVEICFDAQ